MTKLHKLNLIFSGVLLIALSPFASAHTAKSGSGVMQDAMAALQMSAHATLRDLQAAPGYDALLEKVAAGHMLMVHEPLLNLQSHGFSKRAYATPSTLIAILSKYPDFQLGEMLANVTPDLRDIYILRIASTIGDLADTNEDIASHYAEFATWSMSRKLDEATVEMEMTPKEAEEFKSENLARYHASNSEEYLVGDVRTFLFLQELLINRPLDGKPGAVEIAEKLLEALGSDSRLFRTGLLGIFAADIAMAPGHLGRDKKFAKLVEIASRITFKLRQPYWHITCDTALSRPAYLN